MDKPMVFFVVAPAASIAKFGMETADGTAWETVWESRTLPGYSSKGPVFSLETAGPFCVLGHSNTGQETETFNNSPALFSRYWGDFISEVVCC